MYWESQLYWGWLKIVSQIRPWPYVGDCANIFYGILDGKRKPPVMSADNGYFYPPLWRGVHLANLPGWIIGCRLKCNKYWGGGAENTRKIPYLPLCIFFLTTLTLITDPGNQVSVIFWVFMETPIWVPNNQHLQVNRMLVPQYTERKADCSFNVIIKCGGKIIYTKKNQELNRLHYKKKKRLSRCFETRTLQCPECSAAQLMQPEWADSGTYERKSEM